MTHPNHFRNKLKQFRKKAADPNSTYALKNGIKSRLENRAFRPCTQRMSR